MGTYFNSNPDEILKTTPIDCVRHSLTNNSLFVLRMRPKNRNLQMRTILLLLTFILHSLTVCYACPSEIKSMCECIDESDGVLLECLKDFDANELMHTLRYVQSQIGLLKLLVIQNAKIPVLTANFFSGLYIKRLEITNSQIQRIEDKAFNGLEAIMQELNLANNRIEKLPVQALNGLNAIVKLNFSGNSIAELNEEDALPRMPKLFDIDLSHNKISNIHKSFFDNTKNSLQTINLGHNDFSEVPAPALRGFRQLMALHLHNNKIKSLNALSFMNLPVLSLLNLASNKIRTIHKQAFLNAPNLRFFYMTNNQLQQIQPNQFVAFEQLEMIDLSNNQIEQLGNNSFSNLIALKQLYLGENFITQIDETAFNNSSITVLILESNELKNINKEFQSATKLQQLSLKKNKIKNVDTNAFHNNYALAMVDLSYNEIFDLAPATFLSQLNMLLVDLAHNKLPRTPYSAFNKRVVTVVLQENPLVCVEKVHMLQQGVGVYIPNSPDLICGNQQTAPDNSTVIEKQNMGEKNNSKDQNEESSFKQQLNIEQSPTEGSLNLHHLPNIRPLSTKRLSTANINQFVDESQFQHQKTSTTKFGLTGENNEPQETTRFNHFIKQGIQEYSTDENEETSNKQNANKMDAENNTDIGSTKNLHSTITKIHNANSELTSNPNIRYPSQVPFLTRPPKLYTAQHIQQSNENNDVGGNIVITQTLPPNIVIAPYQSSNFVTPPAEEYSDNAVRRNPSNIKPVELEEFKSEDSSETNYNELTQNNREFSPFGSELDEGQEKKRSTQQSWLTAMVVICLSTVALVMCAVFVGMCVAKRHQIQLIGSSSDSAMGINSGQNSLALQHNSPYGCGPGGHVIYAGGTLTRENGNVNRLPPLHDDIYGWIYPPSTYSTYRHK